MPLAPPDSPPRLKPDEERNLDLAFASVMDSAQGKLIFEYMRRITINAVQGPDASFGQLMHREGARWLVAIAEMRAESGRKAPNVPDPTVRRPAPRRNRAPRQ